MTALMRILPPVLLSFIIILAPPRGGPINADIYSWKDLDGFYHFSNVQPPDTREAILVHPETSIPLSSESPGQETFQVLHIYDGDSLKVGRNGLTLMIRLAGIDAPETRHGNRPGQRFSIQAKKRLQAMVHNRAVCLKAYGLDTYNRQLAVVFCKGVNINLEMIRAGLAEVYPGPFPEGLDRSSYLEAEAAAKNTLKGIWSLGDRYISPGQWRKRHPRK